jgi:hypothetical protein
MPRNAHYLQSSETVYNFCTKLNPIVLQRLATGYSPWRPGFDSKAAYVDFFGRQCGCGTGLPPSALLVP